MHSDFLPNRTSDYSGQYFFKHRYLSTVIFSLGFLLAMAQPGNSKTDLLKQYRTEVTEEDEQHHRSPKLHSAILVFLFTVNPKNKFSTCVQAIITCSIENIDNWNPLQAANAFRHIEKFALNLVNYPWQIEFQLIKMYTGFWKLKIEQHLDCVLPLFKKMGYEKLDNDVLELQHPPTKEVLIEIALDCFIAFEEMRIYEDIFNAIDYQGFNMQDVHKCRTVIAGNKDTAIDWITRTCKPTFRKVQHRFEHESLDNNLPPPPSPITRSYNDSEFPPPPTLHDFDMNTKSHNHFQNLIKSTDSGYHSKQNSKRSHITEQNDYVPAQEANRVISLEDDMFKPKTYEDHLKLVERHAESSSASSGSKSSKSGSMNDWDHVTVGLKQKFGDDYYAGLRGDIINIGQKDDSFHTAYTSRGGGRGGSHQIVTADIHNNDIRQTIRSPQKQSPGSPSKGKIARISKSTSKPSSPQAYVQEPTAQQLGDMVAKSMRLKTDSSPDISRPPVPYQSQGPPYQPPNFSTFGVDQLQASSSKDVEISDSYEPTQSFSEEHDLGFRSNSIFGQPEGFSDGLTRRMYQADSQTSLNKEQYMPTMQNMSQPQDEKERLPLYARHIKGAQLEQQQQQRQPLNDLNRYSEQRVQQQPVSSRSFTSSNVMSANKPPSQQQHHHQTAPLLPRRTAPAVPPRRQHVTAPLVPSRAGAVTAERQCPHCTYANPQNAKVCGMCHRSMDSRLLLATVNDNSSTTTRLQCNVCTLVNDAGVAVCKACANPLQT